MKFLKTTILTGIPFGLIMGLFFSLMNGWRQGMLGGLFAGLFFGLAMAAFSTFQSRRFQNERPDLSGETLLHEGPANHLVNREGVGGWLYLTNRRLLFRSHRFNLQPHETSLLLSEIASAIPVLTAGFIPNGLHVATTAGAMERFVVSGRKPWSDAITSAKARKSDDAA